jgi:predicted permease
MLSILSITAPIYLCIALGFACVRWGVFTKADMRVLGQFVIQIALPALLFNALATRPLHEVLHPGYLLAYAAGSMSLMLGALWVCRRVWHKSLTESAYIVMGMTCSNSGYVGYPVMLLAFGPLAGVILALNVLVENLLKLPLLMGLADVGAQGNQGMSMAQTLRQTAFRLLRNPMMVAIFAGVAVSAIGVPMPDVLKRTVTLFSGATSGLALFIIGGNLVGLALKGMRFQVSAIAVGKLLLHPLAVYGAVMLLPVLGLPAVDGNLRLAAVLSAAMPMLGIYSLLAQRHGHEGFTAAALLGSTAASFFSISALLWLLGHGAV